MKKTFLLLAFIPIFSFAQEAQPAHKDTVEKAKTEYLFGAVYRGLGSANVSHPDKVKPFQSYSDISMFVGFETKKNYTLAQYAFADNSLSLVEGLKFGKNSLYGIYIQPLSAGESTYGGVGYERNYKVSDNLSFSFIAEFGIQKEDYYITSGVIIYFADVVKRKQKK